MFAGYVSSFLSACLLSLCLHAVFQILQATTDLSVPEGSFSPLAWCYLKLDSTGLITLGRSHALIACNLMVQYESE